MDTLNAYRSSSGLELFYSNNQVIFCNRSFSADGTAKEPSTGNFSPDHTGGDWQMYFPSPFLDADSAIITIQILWQHLLRRKYTYNEIDFTNTSPVIYDDNSFRKVTADGDVTINGNMYLILFIQQHGTITLESGSTQTSLIQLLQPELYWLTVLQATTSSQQASFQRQAGMLFWVTCSCRISRQSAVANLHCNNSIAVSNVTGWNIPAPVPQSLYWVGGSGTGMIAHWLQQVAGRRQRIPLSMMTSFSM